MKRALLALASIAAICGALWLLLMAAFPYMYAESGSASYARAHRGEATLEVLAAVALLALAWYGIRHSLSGQVWLGIAGLLVAGIVTSKIATYVRVPDGVRPAGGNWYVVLTQHPTEFDPIGYDLYYKRGLHYESVDDLVTEYHFLAPDCIIFRGAVMKDRAKYAMCGYRAPAGTYDTTMADATLLAKARTQPAYHVTWESDVQQEDFGRRMNTPR